MNIVWGLVITALGLLAWVGQTVSWLAPARAEQWSLTEPAASVEPAFHADVRGEAMWDACTLWTLVVAGVLLTLDHGAWPYFGLVGGAIYLYFAGRGIVTRREMLRRGLRIGEPQNVRINISFLVICGVAAAVTIIAGAVALAGR